MKGKLPRADQVVSVILVACALIMTALVARRELSSSLHTHAAPEPRRVEAWDDVQGAGQVLSGPDGVVSLVEFSDFQCPYCGHFYHTLDSLIADYPGQLRVVYRHFPISSIHPDARGAAVASECAARQGRFAEYYHALFQNQGRLPLQPWTDLAHQLDLDSASFAACMNWPDVEGRIAADSAMVARLGLRGTPTVIIDGWELPGTPTREVVRSYIETALKRVAKVGK